MRSQFYSMPTASRFATDGQLLAENVTADLSLLRNSMTWQNLWQLQIDGVGGEHASLQAVSRT